MPVPLRLEDAYALRDNGRYSASYEAFLEIEAKTDNVFVKANARLGAALAAVGLGNNDLSRSQLATIREFLTHPVSTSSAEEAYELQRLKIAVEIQEATIEAAEGKAQAALSRYNSLIDLYKTDLVREDFRDIRDTLYGEKAFLLADLLSFEGALPILEKLEGSQSRNSSVLFYLGYCYMEIKRFGVAREKLEKAIALGLIGNFSFRAHWALGISLCKLGDYASAKTEFERSRSTASPADLANGRVLQWLEYCCEQLGLKEEAIEYARLIGGTGGGNKTF